MRSVRFFSPATKARTRSLVKRSRRARNSSSSRVIVPWTMPGAGPRRPLTSAFGGRQVGGV